MVVVKGYGVKSDGHGTLISLSSGGRGTLREAESDLLMQKKSKSETKGSVPQGGPVPGRMLPKQLSKRRDNRQKCWGQ